MRTVEILARNKKSDFYHFLRSRIDPSAKVYKTSESSGIFACFLVGRIRSAAGAAAGADVIAILIV